MALRRWLVISGLMAGCAAPAPRNPAPVPTGSPVAVTPTTRPADDAQAPLTDSVRALRDSVLDNAVLDLLADAVAPSGPMSQAGDPLETAAAGPLLDISTYADHPRVRFYLDFFQGTARSRMDVWLGRLPVYERLIRTRFEAEGIPTDLVYLGLIESGYSNSAVSRSRAVGMWQFMLPTARWIGLTVDRWVDERRDPVKATDAAARYLSRLAQQFGSYYLAAAAYNGGPGTVSRGLGRLDLARGNGDGPGDPEFELEYTDDHFFTLAGSRYIRQETKDYVPKLIAAALIGKDPMAWGFDPIPAGPPFPTDSIVVPDATGLDVIARLAEVPVEAVLELNPHYLRKVTPPGRPSVVRLPGGSMDSVVTRYAVLPPAERVDKAALARLVAADAPVRGATHTVRNGETLGGIARRYRVTVAQLRAWNPSVPRSGLIRVGQRLRVSTAAPAAVASTQGGRAAPGTHLVQRGETLSALARRYGTTVQALMSANNLRAATDLKAGQRIRIPA